MAGPEPVEVIDAELRLLADRRHAAVRAENYGQAMILSNRIEDLLDRRLEARPAGTGGQPELTR